METKEQLTKEQLRQIEKRGRWLRRHAYHDVIALNIDGAIVGVCQDCDKAVVNRERKRGQNNTI